MIDFNLVILFPNRHENDIVMNYKIEINQNKI